MFLLLAHSPTNKVFDIGTEIFQFHITNVYEYVLDAKVWPVRSI